MEHFHRDINITKMNFNNIPLEHLRNVSDKFTRRKKERERGLWRFMPLSTIFQLYRGGQFNV
jgi:hypothetical protein